MSINYIRIMVRVPHRSLRSYQDLLGFTNVLYGTAEPGPLFQGDILDAMLGAKDAVTGLVIASSSSRTRLELQQSSNPLTEKTPDHHRRYSGTGITELALDAPDLDDLFACVRAAAWQTQANFI